MKSKIDVMWKLWEMGTYVYDRFYASDMEERINTLEHTLTRALEERMYSLEHTLIVYQNVIMLLTAGLFMLISYIIFRQH